MTRRGNEQATLELNVRVSRPVAGLDKKVPEEMEINNIHWNLQLY